MIAAVPASPKVDLTPQQIANRAKGIGGSDAKRIMDGDVLALWEEKTGRREPEDLTWKLPVQVGKWTEGLNALWFAHETGLAIDTSAAVKTATLYHPAYAFMLCHLDGIVTENGVAKLWEAKHTNPFEDDTVVVDRSFAQMQHNMECGDYPEAFLSVIYGNSKYRHFRIARDADYIGELLQREAEFWHCVETDTPPTGTIVEPVVAPKFEELRTVDLSANNMWGDAASTWLQYRSSAKAYDAAEATLKGLVEPDVGFAYGKASYQTISSGKSMTVQTRLVIARSRNNRLTVREATAKDKAAIAERELERSDNVARQ
jgi:hypothetical protein